MSHRGTRLTCVICGLLTGLWVVFLLSGTANAEDLDNMTPLDRLEREKAPIEVYRGDSLYNLITITDVGTVRCMYFGRTQLHRETCVDMARPDVPLLEYSRLMMLGFAFQPDTKRVALLGLGGGFLSETIRRNLPGVKMDTVEVDEKVIELAKKYFNVQTDANHTLIAQDGRQYLKKSGKKYDQIMCDAFLGDFLPEHMTTREFLELCKSRLNPGGIVLQNVFYDSKLFDHQVQTFRSVFKDVHIFTARVYANAILIAGDDIAISGAKLDENIARFNGAIGMVSLSREMKNSNDMMQIKDARVLTDAWSPSNLLLQQRRE